MNSGRRDYQANPVPVIRRGFWEFQAVLEGECAPRFPDYGTEARSATMWVFTPESPHGWTSYSGDGCEMVVFHFDAVPAALSPLIPSGSMASVHLEPVQLREVRELYARCWQAFHHPGALSSLVIDHALLGLSVMVAGQIDLDNDIVYENRSKRLVMSVLARYEEQMERSPTLAELAASANVSESTLRRLFWTVLHAAPHRILTERRLARAQFLMRATNMSIAEIAFATGFRSASSFSRTFRTETGLSPVTWKSTHPDMAEHFL